MDNGERKRLLEVQDLLSSVNLKILEMLKTESRETFMSEEIITKKPEGDEYQNWALPKTGKFQWYKMSNEEGKIRKCENANCDLFLKYNNDKKTYEHWKIDANTGKAFFVFEGCGGEYP